MMDSWFMMKFSLIMIGFYLKKDFKITRMLLY